MQWCFGSIQIFDERNNAAFVVEDMALVGALINNLYLDAGIQEGHFANTL